MPIEIQTWTRFHQFVGDHILNGVSLSERQLILPQLFPFSAKTPNKEDKLDYPEAEQRTLELRVMLDRKHHFRTDFIEDVAKLLIPIRCPFSRTAHTAAFNAHLSLSDSAIDPISPDEK
jgi:hypothetical protein